MPAQDRAWCDQAMSAQHLRQSPDQRGEDRSIRSVQAWCRVGSAQHGEVVAQHQEFDVLGRRRAAEQQQLGSAAAGRSNTADATTRPTIMPRRPGTPIPQVSGTGRILEPHTHRRLLRRTTASPPLSNRKPQNQPCSAHHGRRPATKPDQRPRLLRRQKKPPERLQWKQCAHLHDDCPSRLRAYACRPETARSGKPGRALRDNSAIQRDRPDPGHRSFGQDLDASSAALAGRGNWGRVVR
jgi:hypothetical protein